MVEQNRENISNLGPGSACEVETAQPCFHFDRRDLVQRAGAPAWSDPPANVTAVGLQRRDAPQIRPWQQLSLFEVLVELIDGNCANTALVGPQIDLCDQG